MPKLVYRAPWLCYIHGYIGKDAADFMDHLTSVPHYRIGGACNCENCGVAMESFKVLHEGVDEPVIILCPACQNIPNIKERVRAKRRSIYPDMMLGDVPNFSSHGIDPSAPDSI